VDDPRKPLLVDPDDAPTAFERRRVEIVSTGIDEALQGRGSNPYVGGNLSWVGLRVPAHVNNAASRYLFMLASFTLAEGARARIVGFRHGWSLGLRQGGNRVVEQFVTDPWFKLPDGNVSWHMRRMQMNYPQRPNNLGPVQPPLQNMAFKQSDTPALLYQTAGGFAGGFYVTLAAYTPPNLGMPWGNPLTPELATFYDLKTDWKTGRAWSSLDIPVEGPCRVQFFASVLQTNPSTRPVLTPPGTFFSEGLSPDEQFLLNFPQAIIWRVAGAFALELEDYDP
jgi:hypothetical protein